MHNKNNIFVAMSVLALCSAATSQEPCGPERCPPGTECRTQDVICKREPCPPVYSCVNSTDLHPSCDHYSCPKGTKCILQDVLCVTAPCYPVPVCIDNSGRCKWTGHRSCPEGSVPVRNRCSCTNPPCCPVPSCQTCITCANIRCAGGPCVMVPRKNRWASPCPFAPQCQPDH